jgi:hypothetical protein
MRLLLRALLLGASIIMSGTAIAGPMPPTSLFGASRAATDDGVVLVRGGRGHHYGWGRGRGHHYGWSRGRHRGWR